MGSGEFFVCVRKNVLVCENLVKKRPSNYTNARLTLTFTLVGMENGHKSIRASHSTNRSGLAWGSLPQPGNKNNGNDGFLHVMFNNKQLLGHRVASSGHSQFDVHLKSDHKTKRITWWVLKKKTHSFRLSEIR